MDSFQNFHKKGDGDSDFSHIKGGVGKKKVVLKKGGGTLSLIFILTLSNLIFLLVSGGVCFAYLHHVSVFSISCEELSLIESNQQICASYKSVIFEKQIHCGNL